MTERSGLLSGQRSELFAVAAAPGQPRPVVEKHGVGAVEERLDLPDPLGVNYLCSARFAAAHRQNPRLGAALILHEALHALSLSENPPTSLEITAGVLARCGP